MLQAKQDLLAALAAGLDRISPGAGARAAFELPKVAAHGDLACTAAMQLAKPLKRNPRQVAEALRESLLATPAFGRWVDTPPNDSSVGLRANGAAGARHHFRCNVVLACLRGRDA